MRCPVAKSVAADENTLFSSAFVRQIASPLLSFSRF